MLLLTGPPGSGKTRRVLDEVREALARRASDFRLIVPTATMAEHLRHQLAREGLVFRPGLIVTLAQFIKPFANDLPQVSSAALHLLVEDALARLQLKTFRAVRDFPGFCASVTQLVEEVSSAGANSELLRPCHGEFAAVLAHIEAQLAQRNRALRGARLQLAADRIRWNGLGGIRRVLFDGFFTLTDPELALVDALRQHADLVVTLPAWPGAERARADLRNMGFQDHSGERRRPQPQELLIAAPTLAQETEEIARRILEEAGQGRPFRDIGIVVRSPDVYLGALRTALERIGIPARFYFSEPLAGHAVVRYLAGAVDAMLAGWNYADLVTVFAMSASGIGSTAAGDRLDFALRERIPGAGLAELRDLTGNNKLLDSLAALEAWRTGTAAPRTWVERVRSLRALVEAPVPFEPAEHAEALEWRGQASALDAFDAVLEETPETFQPDATIAFPDFWRQVKAVQRLTPLRIRDARRNVVHVMDAYEARQWELPVVFVCGLLEKRFPQYHPQNPILGDEARLRLRRAGLWLRTSGEHQIEERFLFELAASRATNLLVLSYPRFNSQGEENLASFFLDAHRLKPVPLGTLTPTAIESFLQCPFQFFARHTLKLEAAPPRPEQRLDQLLKGSIVHKVLQEWHRRHEPMETLFERLFSEVARVNNVPPGYRTEVARLEMLRALRGFLQDPRLRDGWRVEVEQSFELPILEDLTVRGRIDRLDVGPEGQAVVFDYKYSRPERIQKRMQGHREGRCVQGGLYVLAAARVFGYEPAGMFYWALRGGDLDGWCAPQSGMADMGEARTLQGMRDLAEEARSLAIRAATEIREGRIAVAPADPEGCDFCDFRDVCRVRTVPKTRVAGGGE